MSDGATFTHDAFLWYNAGQWGDLGLAVPNYGNDTKSQNGTIRSLCDMMGRNLQAIMYHTDARLNVPPSINTLTRVHKLCVRARSILSSRAVPPATPNMESSHALPAPEDFKVFPVPYFTVRNLALKEWCGYILIALTDAMQHTENARPLEISTDFAGMIGQYIKRIYRRLAVEMFNIPFAEADANDFTLTDDQLRAYNPGQWFTSTEMIDTVSDLVRWPTEDDIRVLTNGIPSTHLPVLGRWPGAGDVESVDTSNPSGAAFASPPG